jgi:hypothetical protein
MFYIWHAVNGSTSFHATWDQMAYIFLWSYFNKFKRKVIIGEPKVFEQNSQRLLPYCVHLQFYTSTYCTYIHTHTHTIFFFLRNSTHCARASSFPRFLDHTLHTTVGRTPLDEWSARRRDLYLTHNTHNRQTSMPPVRFKPTTSADERPQTYALDRAATGPARTRARAHTHIHTHTHILISKYYKAFTRFTNQISFDNLH